ncbi:T9SS type A sorting domain-containing protein [Foetidibacter luteolus]|uniref:T9SS type A sorting domain-containing protein n=1 Tax=Foetidibacter luteolus TaxID=2608880 RepID=UPI00129B9A86|nr:T9SS type A sorting domain-containing protein [Foetidibacter luteolus]
MKKVFSSILLLMLFASFAKVSNAATYTVTNTGDNGGSNPAAGAGTGTLRQAIIDANANSGADNIVFNISGSGVKTITLSYNLPVITGQVFINGYSQPGSSAGTIAARTILVQVVCNFSNIYVFDVQASNTQICGIAFSIAGNGSMIGCTAAQGANISNVFIWGNYFNTGADGNSITGAGYALELYGKTNAASPYASNVRSWIIGTNGDGTADANEGNLFTQPLQSSGSNLEPLRLYMCDNFIIAGNTFGLRKNGTVALQTFSSSGGSYGVALTNCTGVRIGTDGNGTSDALERNVFAGFGYSAVVIFANISGGGSYFNNGASTNNNRAQGNHLVAGNYFGTDINGNTGSNFKNYYAISIRGSNNNTIGSATNAAMRNIIVNSYSNGIIMNGERFYQNYAYPASNNTIAGNYIGVLSNGTTAAGNGWAGIFLNTYFNLSSGDISVTDNIITKNIIANNGGPGIHVRSVNNTKVYDNTFTQNSIYNNVGLGINLASSTTDLAVTPNDGVLSTLANSGTNVNLLTDYAVITEGSLSGNILTLKGFIGNSDAANTAYNNATIEFFIADNTDNDQNGPVLSYNGVQITGPVTIANYNPALLTVTFNQNGNSGFSFNYAVVDAAGVQSDPASYTVTWGLGVLAVKLVDFTAQKRGDKALLNWQTAEENGKELFELQRSADSHNWQTIARLPARGGSGANRYSSTDSSPMEANNYYRVALDNEGIKAYSAIQMLDFAGQWQVKLSPNPAKAGEAVTLQSNKALSSIRLLDMQGKTLRLINGSNVAATCQLNSTSLAKGMYFVQVINSSGKMKTFKLIKVE